VRVKIDTDWKMLVRTRLDEIGMSKSELARRVGASPSAISQLLDDDGITASALVPAINRQLEIPGAPGRERPHMAIEGDVVTPAKGGFKRAVVPKEIQEIYDWIVDDRDQNFDSRMLTNLDENSRRAILHRAHQAQLEIDAEYEQARQGVRRAEDQVTAANAALREAKYRLLILGEAKSLRDAKYTMFLDVVMTSASKA
jgi:transcriptional regulator with XRE-family HTH domain